MADISLIYHMIRGQGTIKLYVVYNVLEVRKWFFDKAKKRKKEKKRKNSNGIGWFRH